MSEKRDISDVYSNDNENQQINNKNRNGRSRGLSPTFSKKVAVGRISPSRYPRVSPSPTTVQLGNVFNDMHVSSPRSAGHNNKRYRRKRNDSLNTPPLQFRPISEDVPMFNNGKLEEEPTTIDGTRLCERILNGQLSINTSSDLSFNLCSSTDISSVSDELAFEHHLTPSYDLSNTSMTRNTSMTPSYSYNNLTYFSRKKQNNKRNEESPSPIVRSKSSLAGFLTYSFQEKPVPYPCTPNDVSSASFDERYSISNSHSATDITRSNPIRSRTLPKRSSSSMLPNFKKPKPLCFDGLLGEYKKKKKKNVGQRPLTCRNVSAKIDDNYVPRLPTVDCDKCDIPSVKGVTHDVMADFINQTHQMYDRYYILDARFDFEYQGGHIKNAIHITSKQQIEDLFFVNRKEHTPQRVAIFVHCEFSQKRGPKVCYYLRRRDRHLMGIPDFPNLHYPELYVINGGYREFFKNHPDLCEPQGYQPMSDPSFAAQAAAGMRCHRAQNWEKVD